MRDYFFYMNVSRWAEYTIVSQFYEHAASFKYNDDYHMVLHRSMTHFRRGIYEVLRD
jgi:hypothetical protein